MVSTEQNKTTAAAVFGKQNYQIMACFCIHMKMRVVKSMYFVLLVLHIHITHSVFVSHVRVCPQVCRDAAGK